MVALLEWFGSLTDNVLSLGYVGTCIALVIEGLGLPFPGDAVMALYGFAAARGDMDPIAVIACSLGGYMTGTVIAYAVSRRYGTHLLNRAERFALFSERSMMRTTGMMERYGPWLLVPGRFLPGVRSVSSYVAGVGRMDFRAFLLYTGIGAILWCTAWVGVGYWFGENMDAVVRLIQSGLAYATGAVLLLLLVIWVYRRRLSR